MCSKNIDMENRKVSVTVWLSLSHEKRANNGNDKCSESFGNSEMRMALSQPW